MLRPVANQDPHHCHGTVCKILKMAQFEWNVERAKRKIIATRSAGDMLALIIVFSLAMAERTIVRPGIQIHPRPCGEAPEMNHRRSN